MEDIEHFFYQEIRDMRKTGASIFSRVSTRKGCRNAALRTPYYFMNRKEQKNLNSKEVVYSMNEILSFDEFKSLDDNMKKLMLSNWVQKYSRDRIAVYMNINSNDVTNLISRYRIELPPKGTRFLPMHGHISISDSQLLEKINKGISFEEFLKFDIKTQCHFIFILENQLESFSSILKDYFKIPDIQYLPNLKNRKPYKDLIKSKRENNALSENIKDGANLDKIKYKSPEIDGGYDFTRTTHNLLKNTEDKGPKNIEDEDLINFATTELLKNKEKEVSNKVKVNVKLSEFNLSISGELDNKSLVRRLDFIIGELENAKNEDTFNVDIDINVIHKKTI